VFAMIDFKEIHDETDETNNVSDGVFIEVEAEKSDLAYDDAWLKNPDPRLVDGEALKIKLDVINNGTAAAKAKTWFYWSEDEEFDDTDVFLRTDKHGVLDAGEINTNEGRKIAYDDLAALGDGFVLAVLDAPNAQMESNEQNNVAFFEFDII
ncbi:MAG: CARDB domain-containing protein, partial [Primorskyibacter sp.]